MTWHPISSREQSSMADTWIEYLCAARDGDGFCLGICVHELLGYIPQEWFDDEGEPLAEYRDEDGYLRVPAEFEGQPVIGHNGEYLLGELGQWNNDETVSVKQLTPEALTSALGQLDWDLEDAREALAGLLMLKGD